MISNIDFLIVGAGLYGATIGRLLTDAGFNCLIIERRNHIGGNIYSEKINGYDKHVYGAHIFHTDNYQVEAFVKQYSIGVSLVVDNLPIGTYTICGVFPIK